MLELQQRRQKPKQQRVEQQLGHQWPQQLLYPLLLCLLASLLQFKPLMVQAVALQGAAPTAISLLLIAESVGADQERAAGLVFWSTLLALISAPAWGVLLRSQF